MAFPRGPHQSMVIFKTSTSAFHQTIAIVLSYFCAFSFNAIFHVIFALVLFIPIHAAYESVYLPSLVLNLQTASPRYKAPSRFGLQHVVATNLVIWIQILMKEVNEALEHAEHSSHEDSRKCRNYWTLYC